jgi:hypothetical protein
MHPGGSPRFTPEMEPSRVVRFASQAMTGVSSWGMRALALFYRALALTAFACVVSGAAEGQQVPILGCRNAIPCGDVEGHRGFGDQFMRQGIDNVFFDVASSFGRGLDLHLVPGASVQGPKELASSRAVAEAARAFVAAHPVFTRPAQGPPPGEPAPALPPVTAPKTP